MPITLDWNRIRKRRLFLAAPLFGGNMHFVFHQSVCNLMGMCWKNKVFMGQKFICNESLVPRGRNGLAVHFLKSDCTDLLFVDADIAFSAEDALSLLQYDEPVVGGIYSRKQIDWGRIARAVKAGIDPDKLQTFGTVPVLNWLGPVTDVRMDALFPVKHLGTGFLRIRREVFEKMIEHYGSAIEYDYSAGEAPYGRRTGYDFFRSGIDERYPLHSGKRQYLSEDWAFCERAVECGFTIYAAPWIRLVHVGNYEYSHDLSVMDESMDDPSAAVESEIGVLP